MAGKKRRVTSVGMAWVRGAVHWCAVVTSEKKGRFKVSGCGAVAGDSRKEIAAAAGDADVVVRWHTRSDDGNGAMECALAPLVVVMSERFSRKLANDYRGLEEELKARQVKVPDARAVLAACHGHSRDGPLTMLEPPKSAKRLAGILARRG